MSHSDGNEEKVTSLTKRNPGNLYFNLENTQLEGDDEKAFRYTKRNGHHSMGDIVVFGMPS